MVKSWSAMMSLTISRMDTMPMTRAPSSTLCSGRTFTTRAGLARSNSATVFMWIPPLAIVPRDLHVRVVRAAAAFRHDPLDVLPRILDVAGLAVHAVLGVDLEPRDPAL